MTARLKKRLDAKNGLRKKYDGKKNPNRNQRNKNRKGPAMGPFFYFAVLSGPCLKKLAYFVHDYT